MSNVLPAALRLAALTSAVLPAHAESLVVGTGRTGLAPGSSHTLEVPRFRPELGELRSVAVELVFGLSSQLTVENLSLEAAVASGGFGCSARLGLPQAHDGVQVALESPKFALELAPFDGAIDFAGPSGAYLEHEALAAGSCVAGEDLARFVARAPGDMLSLPLELAGAAPIDLPPSAAGGLSVYADVHVVVRYEFEPVFPPAPIPAGMP